MSVFIWLGMCGVKKEKMEQVNGDMTLFGTCGTGLEQVLGRREKVGGSFVIKPLMYSGIGKIIKMLSKKNVVSLTFFFAESFKRRKEDEWRKQLDFHFYSLHMELCGGLRGKSAAGDPSRWATFKKSDLHRVAVRPIHTREKK